MQSCRHAARTVVVGVTSGVTSDASTASPGPMHMTARPMSLPIDTPAADDVCTFAALPLTAH